MNFLNWQWHLNTPLVRIATVKVLQGGLESHPRLTNGVLYRTSESSTTMKHARATVLALAPPNFSISISSCYNYTENFGKNSHQAARHHVGMGVNAQISLKLPPRIGVEQLVINLHWSTIILWTAVTLKWLLYPRMQRLSFPETFLLCNALE